MLSVKCGPFLYDLFCCLGIKEARSSVAGLDTGAEIVCQSKFIMIEMLGQRFNRGRRPAASVLDQRNEHPAHAGSLLPRAVIDILPGMNELLRPRQRPIAFAVAHAAFARTVQVI